MAAELRQAVSRWLAAENGGDEASADAALAEVFGELPEPPASRGLTARIVRAAAKAPVAAGRRRLRSTGRRAATIGGILAGAAAGLYLLIRVLLPLLVGAFVRAITLLLNAVLWMSVGFSTGLDLWTMLARAGRWAGAALTTPQVAVTLVVVEVIGGLALYVIQRLLASERESSRP